MINIFQVGSVVTGNSFIGRKELVKQYKKQLLNKSKSSSLSIRGITRTGKTSFITNVFNKIPENVLYCYVDMKEPSNYYELWDCILDIVHDYLKKHNLINEDLCEWLDTLKDANIPWIKFVRTVKKIFSYLSDKKIKTIIVLDEFDYAATIFENQTQKWELFRSLVSGADFFITAILISRRNLHEIEGQTFQSSTFKGVFDARYFTGFNEDDLVEYYNVFAKKSINISDEQKKEIEYYAGNSPYLLSIIGNRIIDNKINGKDIIISEIFKKDCKQINEYYDDILTHLTRDGSRDKLISEVLGPKIGITLAEEDELQNLGYLHFNGDKGICISEYFNDYLRNNKLNEPIWEKINTTEKKIKIIIENEKEKIKQAYGINSVDEKSVEKEILSKTQNISEVDIKRYDSFISTNKRDWNRDSSYFDVMSLTDSFKIIIANWLIFNKYFNNEKASIWEPKFELIGKARNPPAHAHEEYLTDTIKRDVDNFCSDIQKYIANVYELDKNGGDEEKKHDNSDLSSKQIVLSSDNKKNKLRGLVFEKKSNLFVREDSNNKEYYIYKDNPSVFDTLNSGNAIEFELREFSAPGKPAVMFAVNYTLVKDSEKSELETKLSGKIIGEKTTMNGNTYYLIERKDNEYPLKAFSNRNQVEYYNHKIGDTVFYRIETRKSFDGNTYESAIILPEQL